jgi:hypothetical protein
LRPLNRRRSLRRLGSRPPPPGNPGTPAVNRRASSQ